MIFFEDEYVKVGGVMLPGVMKSMDVKCDALIEEQDVKGSSKKPKQATGYEDAKITLEIILVDGVYETKEKKLEKIQSLFRKKGQAKPMVYDIVSKITAIRGISQVLFKSLSTKEQNKKSEIIVNIEFWEYVSMTITASKKSGKKKSSTSSGKSSKGNSKSQTGSAKSKTGSVNLNSSYKNYLNSRGQAPKFANKAGGTPAVDNDSTKKWTAPLGKMPF